MSWTIDSSIHHLLLDLDEQFECGNRFHLETIEQHREKENKLESPFKQMSKGR